MLQPGVRRATAQAMALMFSLAWGAMVAARADSYPRQPGIRIVHYDFDVTVRDDSNELMVIDTVQIHFLASGVRGMDLDLCKLVPQSVPADRLNPCLVPVPRAARGAAPAAAAPQAPSSTGRGMTVTSVTDTSGKSLNFQHQSDRVHIDFAAPSQAGQDAAITIRYHGVPATGLFIGDNRYGDRVFFTDNWPNKARNWLATEDHISVKATKTIAVTAPAQYQVISNGLMTESTDLANGQRRTVWAESEPIPSWQFSLGIARFAVENFGQYHGVPFSAWVFPQNREAGFHAIDQSTQSIVEFYSDHIAPYSYEKLAQVEATGGGGATEPASSIFYYGGFGASSHEIAHHWFGDAVTESDWDDVWLSEGFATYFALLYTEHMDGRDAFIAGVKRTRDTALNYILNHPNDTVVHNNLQNISDVFSNSAQIYQGGAMVLQTLRGVLGDTAFWNGIRLYSARYRNGSATTDDFRHAMEEACKQTTNCASVAGNDDLSWFFHQWLNRGSVPSLSGGWHYDSNARQLVIDLDQTQSQGLYRLPMDVGYTLPPAPAPAAARGQAAAGGRGNGGGRGQAQAPAAPRIVVDQQHNEFKISLDREPTDVQIDPECRVPLMQLKFARQ